MRGLTNITRGTVSVLNSLKASVPFLIDVGSFLFLGLFAITVLKVSKVHNNLHIEDDVFRKMKIIHQIIIA